MEAPGLYQYNLPWPPCLYPGPGVYPGIYGISEN